MFPIYFRFALLSVIYLLPLIPSRAENPVKPFLVFETSHLENIRDCALSNDGTELFFTHQKPDFSYSVIYTMKLADGIWSKPKKASFSTKGLNLEPVFSPDNLRLYFVSNRTTSKNDSADFDIWYVERKTLTDVWSAPIHPEASFNSSANEFYPSVCSNGDLYFTSDRKGTRGKDDIFCAPFKDGKYTEAYSLSDSINTSDTEYNAFISPDGSYLIFGAYKRTDGYGSGDLYLSRSLGNGEWSKAINLGPLVNSKLMDYCPFVLGNTTLYFTRKILIDTCGYGKSQIINEKKYPGGRSYLFSVPTAEVQLLK